MFYVFFYLLAVVLANLLVAHFGPSSVIFPLSRHPGAVLEHCYKVPESLMTATSVAGNRIAQIDWEPAYDKYQQMVMDRYGTEVTPENFYRMGVHFPFALMRADGEVLVRIPVADWMRMAPSSASEGSRTTPW